MHFLPLVNGIFYFLGSRDEAHIPLQYRYYQKSRLKVYPKTCVGVPLTRMRTIQPGKNKFKIVKQRFDNDFIPAGKCIWWIADRKTASSYLYKIEQDCILNDAVYIDLKPNLMCTECVLRLSVILDQNDAYDGWYDSCIDFKYAKNAANE